jgi:pimeloyl-ACP methyl ester carboxylesterase
MPYLQTNDIITYYEVTGKGEPLVFIHGLGSSSEDWKFQIDYFSKYYNVLVYDIRGHGKSQKPIQKYSIEQFAKDCYELILQLGFSTIHVVGFSLGGTIAFQLAVMHLNIIKSLTIVNSLPEVRIKDYGIIFKIKLRLLLVRVFGLYITSLILSKQLFSGRNNAQIRREFIRKWHKNDKKAYLASVKSLIGWSVKPYLNLINVPTLIISSEFDYTSVESKKEIVRMLPKAQLIIVKNSRHALPVENPIEFNKILMNNLIAN